MNEHIGNSNYNNLSLVGTEVDNGIGSRPSVYGPVAEVTKHQYRGIRVKTQNRTFHRPMRASWKQRRKVVVRDDECSWGKAVTIAVKL